MKNDEKNKFLQKDIVQYLQNRETKKYWANIPEDYELKNWNLVRQRVHEKQSYFSKAAKVFRIKNTYILLIYYCVKEQRLESVHSLGFGTTLWKKIHEDNPQSSLSSSLEDSLSMSQDQDDSSPSELEAYIDSLAEDSFNLYTRSKDRRGSNLILNHLNEECLTFTSNSDILKYLKLNNSHTILKYLLTIIKSSLCCTI